VACECLKAWWRERVVTAATPGTKAKKRKGSDLEKDPDCLMR